MPVAGLDGGARGGPPLLDGRGVDTGVGPEEEGGRGDDNKGTLTVGVSDDEMEGSDAESSGREGGPERAGVFVLEGGLEGGRIGANGGVDDAGRGLKPMPVGGGGPPPLGPLDGGPLGGGGVGVAAGVVAAPAFLFTHFFRSGS